jgi:hypothetical protein
MLPEMTIKTAAPSAGTFFREREWPAPETGVIASQAV